MQIKVKKIDHHRNGIAGNGFYVVLFSWRGNGDRGKNFIATVFEEAGNVAVLDVDLLTNGTIEFMQNSWRGDHFEGELRKAIAQWSSDRTPYKTA